MMSFNKPLKITETCFSDRTKSFDQLQTAAWEASTIEFLSFYSKYFSLVYIGETLKCALNPPILNLSPYLNLIYVKSFKCLTDIYIWNWFNF